MWQYRVPWEPEGKQFELKSVKMSEELQKAGLYIDDIYYLRVLDPKIATETNDLKEECNEYAESKFVTKFWLFQKYSQLNLILQTFNTSRATGLQKNRC